MSDRKNKISKGMLITFEGGEGSGKTTLLRQIADYCAQQGHDVLTTREPGGTSLGEAIRNLLLHREANISISSKAELLLFLADRAQHIEEKIAPALEAGKIVLCDRFNDSTIAYQGGARGLGIDYVQNLCALICGPVKPILTFFLNVSPEIGLARSRSVSKEHAASGELDRIESETLDFHRTMQEAFIKLAEKDPVRMRTINAEKSEQEVYLETLPILNNLFTGIK